MKTESAAVDTSLHAMAFYLTAFRHDAALSPRHRQFVLGAVTTVAEQRMTRTVNRDAPPRPTNAPVGVQSLCMAVEDEVQSHAGQRHDIHHQDGTILSELKLRCFELFARVAPEARASLFAATRKLVSAEGLASSWDMGFMDQLETVLAYERDEAPEGCAPNALRLAVHRMANRIVVRCDGALDARSADAFTRTIEPLLSGAQRLNVAIALGEVHTLTTAGVRALARARVTAAARGIELRMTDLNPTCSRILELVDQVTPLTAPSIPPPTHFHVEAKSRVPSVTMKAVLPVLTVDAGMEALRSLFPTPVSDPAQDAHFMFTLFRGVDQIDAMKKGGRSFLGERKPVELERARAYRMPDKGSELVDVVRDTASYLEGHILPGHPLTQQNVIPPPTIASIAGYLFAGMHNPNIVWDQYCHRLAEAEVEVASAMAAMVGYDPTKSAGVFTFGGTGTTLYGIKIGLEKAMPGSMLNGLDGKANVFVSEAGHYATKTAVGWLGLGVKSVVSIATDDDNAMRPAELETAMRRTLDAGEKVAAIVATIGSTDAFGMDNVEHIVRLRDDLAREYQLPVSPHVHVDAVIGWAFAAFNTYDFTENRLGFDSRTLRCIWDTREMVKRIHLADSIGIDFHKTGFTPYVSSLFLSKDVADFGRLARTAEEMPYLFQWGSYHPGEFTLETSRSGGSVLAALANIKCLGREGYQRLLGHIVAMAEILRGRLERSAHAVVVNDYNYGPVTLFRVYPRDTDPRRAYHAECANVAERANLERHNEFNRRVFNKLMIRAEDPGGVLLSLTDRYRETSYGAPIVALKSYVISPFTDAVAMRTLTERLEEAMSAAEG